MKKIQNLLNSGFAWADANEFLIQAESYWDYVRSVFWDKRIIENLFEIDNA